MNDRHAAEKLLRDIQAVEDRAYRLGLPRIGKDLNNAKNNLGWMLESLTPAPAPEAADEKR